MGVNYGLNKVRFMAPVKSGSKVRGRFKLLDVTQRPDGAWQSTVMSPWRSKAKPSRRSLPNG